MHISGKQEVSIQRSLLGTISGTMLDKQQSPVDVRILCDTGSQLNFITEQCVQRLQLGKTCAAMALSGVGGATMAIIKHKTECVLWTEKGDFAITVQALVIPTITTMTPKDKINRDKWPHLANLDWADSSFDRPGKVDMLIGAGIWAEIVKERIVRGTKEQPIAQETRFGWVVFGAMGNEVPEAYVGHCTNDGCNVLENLHELIKRFWVNEEPPRRRFRTAEQQLCEEIYASSVRLENGRYIVDMPINPEAPPLGESRNMALRRLFQNEARFERDPGLKEKYVAFMTEYEQLGHMRKVRPSDSKYPVNYLPNHAVAVDSKFRVVFDGSAKTTSGMSLNDVLMTGEKLQDDLPIIVIRFRMFPVALTSDIVKMYRQIMIAEKYVNQQRILFRASKELPITESVLLTATYGTRYAAHSAIRTLIQLARDFARKYPRAARALLENFAVDDALMGADNIEAAIALYKEITLLLKEGGFELKKWASNSHEVMREIDQEDNKGTNLSLQETGVASVLGLNWNPEKDGLYFKVRPHSSRPVVTKREVVSVVAKLYDPMGQLAPYVIRGKILIQKLWQDEIEWDDPISKDRLVEWNLYQSEMQEIAEIEIPRWIGTWSNSEIELHTFCDASNIAYGAAVYCRSTSKEHGTRVGLIMAKTRVAPLQQHSTPRLELCATELGAEITSVLSQKLGVNTKACKFWTDSSIALQWIGKEPAKLQTFVANKVAKIQELTMGAPWSHVSTHDNPADIASRGCSPKELDQKWWTGPKWLQEPVEKWPISKVGLTMEQKEALAKEVKNEYKVLTTKVVGVEPFLATKDGELIEIYRNLSRVERVTAYVIRATRLMRKEENIKGPLTNDELVHARGLWIRRAQSGGYQKELKLIKDFRGQGHIEWPKESKIGGFHPILDKDGILRATGRLENSALSHDEKYPVLIPGECKLAELIIAKAHRATLHGGCQLTMQYLRRQYWIIGMRKFVKQMMKQCVICTRHRQQLAQQIMAPLPTVRVTPGRCFESTGVDFYGPFVLKARTGRVSPFSYSKGYTAVFICMRTKAVHLEVVSSLTTSAFISAFTRFTARRGRCEELYSDNGSTFVGTQSEYEDIKKCWKALETDDQWLALRTIFKRITPRAPHQGGLWEAAVKSAKGHLKKVIGETVLTYEEMSTVLAEVEACLNSRPLITLRDDPLDQLALTPGHFLVGTPLIVPPAKWVAETPMNRLSRWKMLQKMTQLFWRRWSAEYITQMYQRTKWKNHHTNMAIGDIVLVKNELLPPTRWPLGRITDVHPGQDGAVRNATVLFNGKELRRPIQKLCRLPVEAVEVPTNENSYVQPQNSPNGVVETVPTSPNSSGVTDTIATKPISPNGAVETAPTSPNSSGATSSPNGNTATADESMHQPYGMTLRSRKKAF